MSKVYCSIYNGIGNQLFSYALGLFLAKKYKKKLIIDLTKLNQINFLSKIGLKRDLQRDFELRRLGFCDTVISFNLIEFIRKIKWLNDKKNIIADFRNTHYDLGEVKQNQNIFSIGWGDFNLVKEVLPEMRKTLSANFKITSKIANALKLIQVKNSVAVHVRRTDFLDPKISGYAIGICNDRYYNNAIRYISEKLENPFFIYFSDDIEYVKNNSDPLNSYFVEGNAGYEDFYLMTMCKHFILANSTFSFWAATLNSNPHKMVCVPQFWYNSPRRQAEFVPEDWTKIAID